jgi:signal transduction histidine kinase
MLFDKSPEKAREKLHTAKDRIRTGLDSIRHAVRVLDSEAVSISLADFLNEINTAADEFVMDTMRKIHMDIPENNDELYIPREHTEFLTGAFKELLSNGVKHGNADVFMVHITADSNHIKLTVKDNGKSDFSAENAAERLREGFGLKKLKSYAEKCGGTAVFSNENGFKSEITLPFEGGHNE